MTVAFDASVILAAILDEPGGDAVFDSLEDAVISAVNVAEVYGYAVAHDFSLAAIDAFFADTGIEVAPFDRGQARTSGELVAVTRRAGLSLGDRACLALARTRNAEVLTADRPWAVVGKDLGLTITLLR